MISRILVAALAGALVAGCISAPEVTKPPPPPPEPPEEVAEALPYPPPPAPRPPVAPVPVVIEPPGPVRALTYFNRARQRPARELRGEFESVRRAFSTTRSEHDRVRLAMLLSLPNTGFGDDGQALELLEPLARDAASEYQGLAQLMTGLLSEQRRAARHASALQQKLDRIRALEREMQQRAATPESRKR